ncbi:PREDICTED: uncharacterized protein LOC106820805 [Priapulus caudatus]|uniref:Uncharacterized protein LOC106820805 n=1 Tax=Priapulus caudatus TaxID=37621 RepID=A0ABM1F8U0_PRICU|nr:PREDICTED: uncharacterized protein LOC106820805 [Priapulus caudatus]
MSEAAAFVTQNQMAQQLQAIAGLQSLGIPPSALQGLANPPASSSSSSPAAPGADARAKTSKSKSEVKASAAAAVVTAAASPAPEKTTTPVTTHDAGMMQMLSVQQMLGGAPFGDFAALGLGTLGTSPEAMAYFPYLMSGLNPFGMPGGSFMHPAMMAGSRLYIDQQLP